MSCSYSDGLDPELWGPKKRYRNGTSTGIFNATDFKGKVREMAAYHAHNFKLNVGDVPDFFKAGIDYSKKGW